MKANAPEKIYINSKNKTLIDMLSVKVNNDDIEYTRTDAFIDKACEWLKENGGSYWMDDYDLPTDDLVSDFRDYMNKSEVLK